MKATEKDIFQAAATIAAGLASGRPLNVFDSFAYDITRCSIELAMKIAEAVPETKKQSKFCEDDLLAVIRKYCNKHEGASERKLASLISAGEGVGTQMAIRMIDTAENMGIIEDIGTTGRYYILRK